MQQSHHCGIETWGDKEDSALLKERSNRTIVGLKLMYMKLTPISEEGSNRTIVGLKRKARAIPTGAIA